MIPEAIWTDPAAFRQHLLIDGDAGPRRLGDCLDPWQRADFEALDPGWRRVAGLAGDGPQRAYLERPRGHSKTSDLAVMATWVLLAARRQISGVAAAADRDQARLLRDAVGKLVALNAWLAEILDVQVYRVTNRHTGSTLEILSSDAATSYGLTPDFIIVDELTHWSTDSLWVSLFSAAAKRSNSMLAIIANAGVGCGSSWQWNIREAARQSDDWYFHSLDGPCASWISEKHLAEQRRMLPAIAFDRLWINHWTTGSGDALTEADISAAVLHDAPWRARKTGWVFVGGLDIGLSKDATALCILGKQVGETCVEYRPRKFASRAERAMAELGMMRGGADEEIITTVEGTGRLRVADVQIWKPGPGRRVELTDVEASIVAAHERYGLSSMGYDPHQAEYLADRLGAAGVPVERVPFTGGNLQQMATSLLDAFSARNIDLFDHPQLLADLRSLRVEERSYGVRLTSPRGPSGHGDCATAMSLAIHTARGFTSPMGDMFLDDDAPLIWN
ncbi:MAG TPA: terminase large subunit [Pirellulales bacterium]|nr:terminase large subunit [Pirellulales bacterium]